MVARKFFQQDASIVVAVYLADDARPFFREQLLRAAKDFYLRAFDIALQKVRSGHRSREVVKRYRIDVDGMGRGCEHHVTKPALGRG